MARHSVARNSRAAAPKSRDNGFMKLIESLEEKVASLDDKKCPLIQEILGQDWLGMSDEVITKVEVFISELLVVQPVFCRTVIRSLVGKFVTETETEQLTADPTVISKKEKKSFSIIHRNLKRLMGTFLMYEDHVVKMLSEMFPYMNRGAHVHHCYITNVLTVSGYLPKSKIPLLHVIVNRLARIDSGLPRSDVEAYHDHLEESSMDKKIKAEGGGFQTIELQPEEIFVPNPLIETLDVGMLAAFQCIDAEIKALVDETTSDKSELLTYFKQWLVNIVETEILPSFGTGHVQFLLFYLAGLHSEFPRMLLEFLWKKMENANTPPVMRIQSMSYISGLLSRANYVSLKVAKRWLTRLSEWANEYISQHSYDVHWASMNLSAHGPFYAVCQTIFYVVAFRNKELLSNKKSSAYMRTLNLGRFITCDLNPLKACSEEVAEAFVEIATQHQISYCRTILDRNQQAKIPTYNSDFDESGNSFNQQACLESFFPFEPYLLQRTSDYVEKFYRPYEAFVKEEPVKMEEFVDPLEMDLSSSLTTDSPFSKSFGKSFVDPMDLMDC